MVTVALQMVAEPQHSMRPGGATLQPLESAEAHGVGRFEVSLGRPVPRGFIRVEQAHVESWQTGNDTSRSTVETVFDVSDP